MPRDSDPTLLPVVRRCTSPTGGLLAAHEHPHLQLVSRSLGPWLHLLLVEDREDSRRFVQQADLVRWGLPVEQAWLLGRENLGHRSHEPATPIEGGVQVTSWGGYASSLLTLEGWWRSAAERVVGEPLALAPDIDSLVVIGDADPQLEMWAEWAFQTFRTTARPLSPAPLGREDLFPRNERLLAAFTYAEQDELLLQTAPEGVYIAELSLHLDPDGRARTHTRCEPGHTCWLPMADVVDTASGTVDLNSLHLDEVPGVHPIRLSWSPES